jgi:hypothetical protein
MGSSAHSNCAACHAPTVLVMIGLAIWLIQFAVEAALIYPNAGQYVLRPLNAASFTEGCDNDAIMCAYPYGPDGSNKTYTPAQMYDCWKAQQGCYASAVRGALTSFAIGRILSFLYLIGLIIHGALLMRKKLA